MATPEFILQLRSKIGTDPLWLPGVKVVLIHQERVLLVRRADNGRWTVPAGILEPGEEPALAAVREVFEETGVHCSIDRLLGVATTDEAIYPNGDRAQYLDVVMSATYVGGEARVNDDENLEVAWFEINDLPSVPPKHLRAIQWAQEPKNEGHFISE
ncbi:DNA mismatch repair protein MutT [Arthrobacter sp. MYb227]|uniref:NUDIX hydrolase n=1 Tax=Arthrobacter sp. MYb227 TaxID=1848601 RepID=UPI000CFC2E88|nr:NUDIX domain-containing protein [Arthrobacter sp. MYb227]PQZ91041.1 DNA mismatch repair protein MutT [Arthrobacter sp. MYb227]